jgi:hypothetical protein
MRPSDFDGWNKSPGGLVLALGIPGLLLGGRAAWTLGGFSIFGGAVFYFFQRFARYLLPFFGPMMIVAAAVPNRSRRLRWIALAVLFASGVAGLGLHAAALSVKLPVIIGKVDRDTYLAARVERYEAFAHANQIWQRGGKILSLDQRTYYLDPPSYQNHWGLIETRSMPLADQVAWLRAQGIAYVLLPLDFVRESGVLRDELMPMLQAWRNAPEYFTLVHTMQTPRRDAKGLETIEFYALEPLPKEES